MFKSCRPDMQGLFCRKVELPLFLCPNPWRLFRLYLRAPSLECAHGYGQERKPDFGTRALSKALHHQRRRLVT